MLDTTMVLFHVAPHDAAYAWAEKHKVVTAGSDVLELFEAVKSAEPKEATGEQATIYGQYLAKQMLASGVPKEIADEFMWCSGEDDLLKRANLMSEEWQEIIITIACGQEVDTQEMPVKSSHIRPVDDDPLLFEALTTPNFQVASIPTSTSAPSRREFGCSLDLDYWGARYRKICGDCS